MSGDSPGHLDHIRITGRIFKSSTKLVTMAIGYPFWMCAHFPDLNRVRSPWLPELDHKSPFCSPCCYSATGINYFSITFRRNYQRLKFNRIIVGIYLIGVVGLQPHRKTRTKKCKYRTSRFAFEVVLWLDFVYFGNVLLKSPIRMLLWSWICMPPGLIYNACQLESTGVLMLENVNKLQHFEACLHFRASKCFLTQVRLSYKSNQPAGGWQ